MGKARGYRRDTFATLAYGLPAATALLEANPSSTLSDCSAHFPCILFSFLVPSFLRVSLRQAGISLAVAMHFPYRRVRPKQFLQDRTRTETPAGGSSGTSSSSVTTNTFRGASVPHTFSTRLAFGGNARSITLTVDATVNGIVVTAPPVTFPIN
ncbi:MAG: hypothetical protein G01um1014106_81 [Parcubacteria group bacterium Gr01-1014_106]|nr:MAG: hypothetical protein G01um1014106_81 [Parcubacteria group bacterium Gr01-1014_106]